MAAGVKSLTSPKYETERAFAFEQIRKSNSTEKVGDLPSVRLQHDLNGSTSVRL